MKTIDGKSSGDAFHKLQKILAPLTQSVPSEPAAIYS